MGRLAIEMVSEKKNMHRKIKEICDKKTNCEKSRDGGVDDEKRCEEASR